MQSTRLWAPGERREDQEAGEVSLRPRELRPTLALGGAGRAAAATGWKNSAGRRIRVENQRHWPLLLFLLLLFLPHLILLLP